MSSVLRQFTMSTDGHVIGTDGPVFDPMTDRIVASARSSAYDEGFAAGMQEVAATLAALEHETKARIATALENAKVELNNTLDAANASVFDLATSMARFIVGEFPEATSRALLERVTAALALIDDEDLTLYLSPTDHPAIEPLLPKSVTAVADPSILPGDARIDGRWAEADVSLHQAWTKLLDSGR